jgi:hypothetical protein
LVGETWITLSHEIAHDLSLPRGVHFDLFPIELEHSGDRKSEWKVGLFDLLANVLSCSSQS